MSASSEGCYRKGRIETALAMETVSTEVKLLASDHRETQVNRVQQVLCKKETTPRESSARSSKEPTSSGTSSGIRKSTYCGRCGSAYHDAAECFFKNKKCFRCNRKGHTRRKCREKINMKNMEDEDVQLREQEDEEELFGILHVPEQTRKQKHPPYIVEVEVQGNHVEMEVDTGASITIISEEQWKGLHGKPRLETSKKQFLTYTGEKLRVRGVAEVEVRFKDQAKYLTITVVEGARPPFLGRNWLAVLRLD